LEQLQVVYVAGTKVTDAGVAKLQSQRSSLKIDRLSPHGKARLLARRDIFQHAILHLALAPGGRQLITGSGDGKLRVFDLATRDVLRSVLAHGDWAFTAEFHPSGQWLASGGGDNLIKFWSWPELEEIGRLEGHTNDIHAIGFNQDGTRLVSAGDDWSVRIWDVAERRELHVLAGHEGSIPGLAMSPDGDTAATASRDGTVRLWSVSRGENVGVLAGHTDDVMSVAFSPDGSELASASYDGTVRVWGSPTLRVGPDREKLSPTERGIAAQGPLSATSHTECGTTFPVSRDWLFAVTWSASGEELIAAAGDGVRSLDRQSGRVLWHSSEQANVSHVINLGADELAASSADASVAVLDAGNGKPIARLWTRFR
jgi:WD40 repeat protein